MIDRRNFFQPAFVLSVALLGHALQISNGFYNSRALAWIAVAFACALAGATTHSRSEARHNGRFVEVLLWVSIAWQLTQLLSTSPGVSELEFSRMTGFQAGVALQAALLAAACARMRHVRGVWFPAVLILQLWLGAWMFRASPDPPIDVFTLHKDAVSALLQGQDPYDLPLVTLDRAEPPSPASPDEAVGYPYPPVTLLSAVPGQLLLNDYRYSELVAQVAAVALIGYSGGGLASKLAAVLLLTTPRGFLVLELGWTEPVALLMLSLTTFLMSYGPVRASWAAGLMLATKQYLPFTGLAVLRSLLLDIDRWKTALLWIVVTGAVCVLPFALWHPNSFMRSVVWLQTMEPFRTDSLSFLIWADSNGYGRGSFLWAVGAALVAAVLSLFTTDNTPSGFATSAAITMFAMFALGSKAFCNYYYFVIGAMCIALAAFAGPDQCGGSTSQGMDHSLANQLS